MGFAPACEREQGARYCDGAGQKVGSASRRNDRFVSLRNRADFQRVYRRGRRLRTVGLTVLMLEGPSAVPRIGIVAGKKVGNAVNRNRTKRRLREAAFLANLRPHTDYILIANPECNEMAFRDLVEAISGKEER
jgi:ribonuclease P protein component